MTPTRLAALLAPALPLAPVLLALAACGGRGGGEKHDSPSAPLGFELAMAGTAGAENGQGSDAGTTTPAPIAGPLVEITAEDLAARLAAGTVRLIDVRTDEEVAQGMIPGAEHIPLDRFDPAALGPSDGREVVLYCRSGRRSAIAGEKLAATTGEPVEHLGGGILAWEEAGQPLEPR